MAAPVIESLRAEAKRRGLKWSHVLAAYREVKAGEIAAREHANEVRRQAWTSHTARTPWAWPWWRIGFRSRYGRLVDTADYKAIRGYDVLHAEVAATFPEFSDDDGCERLWSFLLSPYNPLPRREKLLERAIEEAERIAAREDDWSATEFVFGANCLIT